MQTVTTVRNATRKARPTYSSDGEKWAAVVARDPAADDRFFYAVRTTGVYCRPSCAARAPRRENVSFHASAAAAARAGFRPCKRCRPDLPSRSRREAAAVADACRVIETAEETPGLAELAARAGMSRFHFHRLFRRIAGVTPRAYASATRQRRAQDELAAGARVTEAIYAAGFGSARQFYDEAPAMLGMTPSAYRSGGAGETMWHAAARCMLGTVLVAATGKGICAILLGDDAKALVRDLASRFPKARFRGPPADFAVSVAAVVELMDDPRNESGPALPLDIHGTAFQRRVWEMLRAIPAGKTASYGEIASRLGKPGAARAVARACAANRLAVAIPCHRAVGADGALTGYRWGVARKRRLLARERE